MCVGVDERVGTYCYCCLGLCTNIDVYLGIVLKNDRTVFKMNRGFDIFEFETKGTKYRTSVLQFENRIRCTHAQCTLYALGFLGKIVLAIFNVDTLYIMNYDLLA